MEGSWQVTQNLMNGSDISKYLKLYDGSPVHRDSILINYYFFISGPEVIYLMIKPPATISMALVSLTVIGNQQAIIA